MPSKEIKKYYYTKNNKFTNSKVNVTFEEILDMSKDEFQQWCIDLRKIVVDLWDNEGTPPVVGYEEKDLIDGFEDMIGFKTDQFLQVDENTGTKDVIRNTSNFSGYVNSFFPTMMKTRINYTDKDDGKSIYDFFARNDLLKTFTTYATRHFKRDSFFHYSVPVRQNDNKEIVPNTGKGCIAATGVEWIEKFEKEIRLFNTHDYWLAPRDEDHTYTGYDEELKKVKTLFINKEELEKIWDIIPKRCKSNVDWERSKTYQLRIFELGQKLFPVGLKAFRVSFCQYAVNFPPMTAKYFYEWTAKKLQNENLLSEDEPYIVWDPSSGWGGRIAGAMAASVPNLHYIGNDPNTDHTTANGRTKYHEVADFINENTTKANFLTGSHNTYEIYQLGSEVMQNEPGFQKYKGKISLVMTSPPYFAKEAYSEDPEQSYKKFSSYDTWRDEFLYETLKTAHDWLHPGGFIIWNISDVKFGKNLLPLADDSIKIMEKLGMEKYAIMKMALSSMPGGNRTNEDGSTTTNYSCRVIDKGRKKTDKGLILKYEPIIMFRKK